MANPRDEGPREAGKGVGQEPSWEMGLEERGTRRAESRAWLDSRESSCLRVASEGR